MTKSELITRLATRVPRLMVGDCRAAVDTIFEALAATLANGDRVEIRGFGIGIHFVHVIISRFPSAMAKCHNRTDLR